jgi:hypothetical protein
MMFFVIAIEEGNFVKDAMNAHVNKIVSDDEQCKLLNYLKRSRKILES